MTVLDLIHSSLRLIGQLGPGRSASASETTDALLILNSMLDSWATEKLAIYETARETYTWPASTASETIGPAGDFDTSEPLAIGAEFGYIGDGSSYETELVDLTPTKWKAIRNKSQTGYPQGIHNNRAYPLANLYLWPIPESAGSLIVYPWRQLIAFTQLTQTVKFPAGYADAIRYNLAVHLGEEWAKPVNSRVERLAAEKKGLIKARNIEPLELGVDEALLSRVGLGDIDYGR